MPKVSVIVPIYNKAQYLNACIESILSQSLSDIELILVDDGSTDQSRAVCERYLQDTRVQLICQSNAGPASARQNGIDHAQGEYLGFVDADDCVESDMYEKMYLAAIEKDADIVMCNCFAQKKKMAPLLESGYYDRDGILDKILPKSLAYINDYGGRGVIRWCNWLRIYKRSMIMENSVRFDPRFFIGEDLQFTYEATLCAKGFVYLGDEYLYKQNVIEQSLSRGYRDKLWEKTRELISLLYEVTTGFKDVDLLNQMHLRAFFFATESIENEFKKDNPHSRKERVGIIRTILNDEICRNVMNLIPSDRLCDRLARMYEGIVSGDAVSLERDLRYYYKKTRLQRWYRKKVRNPFVKFCKKIIGRK